MGVRAALIFILFIYEAQARFIHSVDISYTEEEEGGSVNLPSSERVRDPAISPLLKDQEFVFWIEEEEDPAPVFLSMDAASPPGGGVRLLDQRFVKTKIVYPEHLSWWQRRWLEIKNWAFF